MKLSEPEFLKSIADLPAGQRAAAIAHRAYVLTALRCGWPLRVPQDWSELDGSARDYNVEAIETWIEHDRLLDAWLHAVLDLRLHRTAQTGGDTAALNRDREL